MAGYLAYHRTRLYAGIVADLYGNDPFVWVTPFVWSHCHARDRPRWFGDQPRVPVCTARMSCFSQGIIPPRESWYATLS